MNERLLFVLIFIFIIFGTASAVNGVDNLPPKVITVDPVKNAVNVPTYKVIQC